jgi:radical SAM protein with 4Fe4S-binding SPASM domain
MHKVFDSLLKAEVPMWPNWIMESTYPTWEGPKNPYSCGRWLIVVDTDGGLRSCNPDSETVVGHIDTIQNWKEIKPPQRWSAKNLEECQGCQWVTICQGGCPYSRKLTYGTYNQKTPFCSAFKTLFPRLLELNEKWKRYSSKNYQCSIRGDK